jgi:hypothetical protein
MFFWSAPCTFWESTVRKYGWTLPLRHWVFLSLFCFCKFFTQNAETVLADRKQDAGRKHFCRMKNADLFSFSPNCNLRVQTVLTKSSACQTVAQSSSHIFWKIHFYISHLVTKKLVLVLLQHCRHFPNFCRTALDNSLFSYVHNLFFTICSFSSSTSFIIL